MCIQALRELFLLPGFVYLSVFSLLFCVDSISQRANMVDKTTFLAIYCKVKVVIFMIWDLTLIYKRKHELLYIHISMNKEKIISYVRDVWKYMTVRPQVLKKPSDTLHTQGPSCQFAWRLNSFLIAVKLCQLNCDFMQILSCNDMQWIIY